MSQFTIVEYPGREQAFTVWQGAVNWRVARTCFFAATEAEAQRWVDKALALEQLSRKAWRV